MVGQRFHDVSRGRIAKQVSEQMHVCIPVRCCALLVLFALCCGLATRAQEPPKPPAANQDQPVQTIRVETNLVQVRVIVRDYQGKPVTGLTKADFQLFDNKKPQVISSFSVEGGAAASNDAPGADRLTAIFFDDYHMGFFNLTNVRDAAKRYLANSLNAGELVAMVSASGSIHVDFTRDRDKLERALSNLQSDPHYRPIGTPVRSAVGGGRGSLDAIAITQGDVELMDEGVRITLAELDNLVQVMAARHAGGGTIAIVSNGMAIREEKNPLYILIDRALHAKVVINALDARGLTSGVSEPSEFMAQAAEGTGGSYVHNTNDMDAGLARVAALNTSSYILGFDPQDLKLDGKFHTLTVKLANREHFTLQARPGYYAEKETEDAVISEYERVEQAMFSDQEMSGLPVHFSTKFDQVDQHTTKFSLITAMDIGSLHFRKEAGENLDEVTLQVGLFDGDGNYVTGQKKRVKMHLSDATLEKLRSTGAALTAELNVKPGKYTVRAVVGESGSQQLGTGGEPVVIP